MVVWFDQKNYFIKRVKTKNRSFVSVNGVYMINGGIDKSNANGDTILPPKDCHQVADYLLKKLKKYYRVKNLGVLICDSWTAPLRFGTVGVALGYYGFDLSR